MHTLQSAKELLYSLPVKVVLAGFESNTLALAKAGWDMSIRQERTMYHDLTIQLALRHGDQRFAIYGLSDPWGFHYGEEREFLQSPMKYAEFFTKQVFHITYLNSDMRFQMMPMRGTSFKDSFEAFDPRPQERSVQESIKNFKFFKVGKPNLKELIVHPSEVPQILDLIMNAQKTTQQEIRERNHSRENLRQYRSGEMFETAPSQEVHAQLISLVG